MFNMAIDQLVFRWHLFPTASYRFSLKKKKETISQWHTFIAIVWVFISFSDKLAWEIR